MPLTSDFLRQLVIRYSPVYNASTISNYLAALNTLAEFLGFPKAAFPEIFRLVDGVPSQPFSRKSFVAELDIARLMDPIKAALDAELLPGNLPELVRSFFLLVWPARPHTLASVSAQVTQ